jgi:3-hydroxyacyl-CoA dehydrogenase
MFPFLAQYIFSGPFMAELQKSGKTVNFEEIFRAFQDATGTATAYEFIRPMNQQEQQAAAAPPPQVQAMMQAKQMDAQTRKEIMDKKVEVELTKAAMQHKSKEEVQAEQSAIQLLNLMAKAKAGAIEPPPAGPMSQE